MDDIDILLRAYPFQDSSRAELQPLLPSFRRRSLDAGQHLWQPGGDADRLWFVLAGQLHNVITSTDGDEIVNQLVGPGESFGQPTLFLPGSPRIGSCIATVKSRLMSLHRDPLLGFMEGHPAAMRRMLESMSILILSQSFLFREVAFRDVRGRVAYQVLKLAEEYGEPVEGGTRIRLKLSQTTLAGLVAASRESVNRALARFVADGYLRLGGGDIVVVRPEALRRELARGGG